MKPDLYVQREFERANIQDGQFNSVQELEQHATNIDHAIARGRFQFQEDARTGLVIPDTHDIYGIVPASHTEYEGLLLDSHNALKRKVDQRSPEVAKIMQKYAQADARAEYYLQQNPRLLENPEEANITRAAFRFGAFELPPQFIFDIDNTMTVENPDYSYYEKLVPGTQFCDPFMAKLGRGVFNQVFPAGWGQTQGPFEQTFKTIGSQVEMRAGINELLSELFREGHTIKVLTAGMDPLAEGILGQLYTRDLIQEVRSVKLDNVTSNYKELNILDMACNDAQRAGAFVGDGSSDEPASPTSLPLAVRFALEGGGFQKALNKTGALYFTYTNHFDILDIRARIENRTKEIGSALQAAA